MKGGAVLRRSGERADRTSQRGGRKKEKTDRYQGRPLQPRVLPGGTTQTVSKDDPYQKDERVPAERAVHVLPPAPERGLRRRPAP